MSTEGKKGSVTGNDRERICNDGVVVIAKGAKIVVFKAICHVVQCLLLVFSGNFRVKSFCSFLKPTASKVQKMWFFSKGYG